MYFKDNLKYLRKKLGIKQSELADRAGFKQSQWSGYEIGNSYPKFIDLINISKFFNISETDLIHTNLSEEVPKHKVQEIVSDKQSKLLELYELLVPKLQDEIKVLKQENENLKEQIKEEREMRYAAEGRKKYGK